MPEMNSPRSQSAMEQKKYEKESSGNSAENRLREDSFFVLPEFDSLPATARLSDVEAFQLSIRHALALLPALFSERTKSKADSDNPAWFRLD